MRTYRGSTHAFEPYEFGREENVIWLHLVKTAAEILVAQMEDTPPDERKAFSQEVSLSTHLRTMMDGLMMDGLMMDGEQQQ